MNRKSSLILSFLILIGVSSTAQSQKISGKVLDEKNQPLAGVSVRISGTATGTTTDLDGQFSLNLPAGRQSGLEFSAIGYETRIITAVELKADRVNELNVVLQEKIKSGENVVVTSRAGARRETVKALLTYQQNAPTVVSVISAEAIRRSPDRTTGEVLKRVSGTSIQEGKYVVIRGLSDRYNQAMLNGILLSSTEPDRKTFSFDLFPSAVIDNIIINKAFVPELPGEWAGGLIQVQTKEIPPQDFVTIQYGVGANSRTLGKLFYQAPGGSLDWLGIADRARALPADIPTRHRFAELSADSRNEYGKRFRNVWTSSPGSAPLSQSFQFFGGFTGTVFRKKAGGTFALLYNQSSRRLQFENAIIGNDQGDTEIEFNNEKFSRDVLAGALANFSLQFNNSHRVSFKNMITLNSSDFVIRRSGRDYILGPGYGDRVKAEEIGFRQNTFMNSQLLGEHAWTGARLRLRWYGGFNILDQYIPDQRRLFYTQQGDHSAAPWYALLAAGASQKSGSIFYSFLNDYISNGGGDVSRSFRLFDFNQTLKAGYLFQHKDRLFDSRPFFVNTLSNDIKQLPPDRIFAPENFTGLYSGVQFGELNGLSFRYMAKSSLHAAFIQFDNHLSKKLRLVWGVRMEHFDQVVGSEKPSDPRHVRSRVVDWLPGINMLFRPSEKVNIRLSGSQTVVRPEFRELSPFAFYDFELNAQVVGNNRVKRTKVSNAELRGEFYAAAGDFITAAVYFKHFDRPIEYYFNRTGPATNTFNVANTKSALVAGAELEFRKKLDVIWERLRNFSITGNLSYIHSRVRDTVQLNRPLQGQSPYLINAGLQFDAPGIGLTGNLLFNQIGRRILFVGDKSIPDIWEHPRPLLDLQLAKKIIAKKGEIKLNISDLLDRPARFYHDLDYNRKYRDGSNDVLAITRRYGTNFSLSFAYNVN